MTYAVLAHRGDTDAELVARELALRSPDAVLVWEDELFLGSRLTHRVDERGVDTELECADGRRLGSSTLRGLVCRLVRSSPPQFIGAAEVDRAYAAMESHALLLSWLASLRCLVVNPPSPRQLSGPQLGPLEWTSLAAASGLRARRVRIPPDGEEEERLRLPAELRAEAVTQVLVIGDRVLGEADDAQAAGCVRLARAVGCAVLGVHFVAPEGDPRGMLFCGAEAMPSLGHEGAVAVAELLAGPAR